MRAQAVSQFSPLMPHVGCNNEGRSCFLEIGLPYLPDEDDNQMISEKYNNVK
jgi:hypothetical protein